MSVNVVRVRSDGVVEASLGLFSHRLGAARRRRLVGRRRQQNGAQVVQRARVTRPQSVKIRLMKTHHQQQQ